MLAHVMARFAPFIFMVFYCNGWQTDRFDNLTAKGFNLHWCKSNLKRPAEQNLLCISSAVQIRDRSCATLTFLCYPCAIQIMFVMLRYFVAVAN